MTITKEIILQTINEFNKLDNIRYDHKKCEKLIIALILHSENNGYMKLHELKKHLDEDIKDKDLRLLINSMRRSWNQTSNPVGYIIANNKGYKYVWTSDKEILEYGDKITRSKRSKMVEQLQLMLIGIDIDI